MGILGEIAKESNLGLKLRDQQQFSVQKSVDGKLIKNHVGEDN